MATTKAKAPATKTGTSATNGAGLGPQITPTEAAKSDAKLLACVRQNAPWIVSALSGAATRAGDSQQWADLQKYLSLANELSVLSGIGQTPQITTLPGTQKAMAASAAR